MGSDVVNPLALLTTDELRGLEAKMRAQPRCRTLRDVLTPEELTALQLAVEERQLAASYPSAPPERNPGGGG
jgi:hypothetical protein